jgi:hypothetical protein
MACRLLILIVVLQTTVVLLLLHRVAGASPLVSVDPSRLKQDIEALSSHGSRVLGYPGEAWAADFVENRLKELGYSVTVEAFSEPVPVDHGATLTIEEGSPIPIYSLWPNLVRTPTTPPDGLSGPLVYGKAGRYQDYDGQRVDGAIVILDFASRNNFLKAFALGAKAVIFLEPEEVNRKEAEAKLLPVPVYAPRYYVRRGDVPTLLDHARHGRRATIRASMTWRYVQGKNLIASLEGTDPRFRDRAILISAYYDGMSVVPGLCPAAEQSCSIVALLELARFFTTHPPARPIVFVAVSGHFLNNSGIKSFLRRHPRGPEELGHALYVTSIDEAKHRPEDAPPAPPGLEAIAKYRAEEERGGEETEETGDKRHPQSAIRNPQSERGERRGEGSFLPHEYAFCLDLSSHSRGIGAYVVAGQGIPVDPGHERLVKPLGRLIQQIADSLRGTFGNRAHLFNGVMAVEGMTWESSLRCDLITDHRYFLNLGRPALAIVTAYDTRMLVDTPSDLPGRVDLDGLSAQVEYLLEMMIRLANDREEIPWEKVDIQSMLGWARTQARQRSLKDLTFTGLAETPVPNATILLFDRDAVWLGANDVMLRSPLSMTGVRPVGMALTDAQGYAYLLYDGPDPSMVKDGYLLDDRTGQIVMAVDRGIQGVGTLGEVTGTATSSPVVLYPFDSLEIFETVNYRNLDYLFFSQELDERDGFPQRLGWPYLIAPSRCRIFFVDRGKRMKVLFPTGPVSFPLVFLHNDALHPLGDGYTDRAPLNTLRGLEDLQTLLTFRRDQMQSHGIHYDYPDRLVKRSERELTSARDLLQRGNYGEFSEQLLSAATVAGTAYPFIRLIANDTIWGLILYLGLVAPFSVFFERLVFGSLSIQRRLLGVTGIFLAICVILGQVHPAFAISTQPYIIIVAFLILSLALFVVGLMTRKFNVLVKEIRGGTVGLHRTDLSRTDIAFTGLMLGIDNMRRRPIRTGLTITTVILLTFAILSLNSTQMIRRFNRLVLPYRAAYDGALFRDRSGLPLSEVAVEAIHTTFGQDAIIGERCWVYRTTGSTLVARVERVDTGVATQVEGAVGLTPHEREITPFYRSQGAWFSGNGPECLLPRPVAQQLGVTESDVGRLTLRFYGVDFRLIGVFDPATLSLVRDLDGERVTPGLPLATQTGPAAGIGLGQFQRLDAGRVLLMDFESLRLLSAPVMSIALKFHNISIMREKIRDFVERTETIFFIGDKGVNEVWSSIGTPLPRFEPALLIPLAISMLLLLNTLLGSVYERRSEIAVYTAVGLNPIHIAMLFIAEALVYAVLSVVLGYLLAQVVVRMLIVTGITAGLNLNYSSTTAAVASLIVLGTVMISAIYPARVAFRIASRVTDRSWRLPEPDGDLLAFEFPLTVSAREALGVCAYYYEYFADHTEESLGDFWTDRITVSSPVVSGLPGYIVELDTWLSPYDLGVSQHVRMALTPSSQEVGLFIIQMTFERLSGTAESWKRLTWKFVRLLREQFLIWRTVREDVKGQYEDVGCSLLTPR